MNCNTTHYRANSSSVPGDPTVVAAARDVAAHGGDATKFIGTFKANYYAWYNGIGLALELFAVSRIFAVIGVRRALYVMPLFALGAYSAAAAMPALMVMRLVKIGENALQYSLQDTTRNALFLVATRVEKFVGKTAIDTVFVRIGAIMSMITVFVGTRLGWSTRTFAAIDVGLAAVWIAFAILVARAHRDRAPEPADKPEPTPPLEVATVPARA